MTDPYDNAPSKVHTDPDAPLAPNQVRLRVSARDDLPEDMLATYSASCRFMAHWCVIHQTGPQPLLAEDILNEFKENVGKFIIGDVKGSA